MHFVLCARSPVANAGWLGLGGQHALMQRRAKFDFSRETESTNHYLGGSFCMNFVMASKLFMVEQRRPEPFVYDRLYCAQIFEERKAFGILQRVAERRPKFACENSKYFRRPLIQKQGEKNVLVSCLLVK